MTLSIGFTLALVSTLLILFLYGRWRSETVALGGLVVLGLASFIGLQVLPSPKQLWTGYSSNAVMSLIAVMLLAIGLQTAGLMDRISRWIARNSKKSELRTVGLVMLLSGMTSAVIQNAAVVALFLPVTTVLSRQLGIPMSRLAMPLAIAATAGGTMTLVSTAPLILVEDLIPVEHENIGFAAPFFVGLTILIASIAIHLVVGHRLLPKRGNMQRLNRGEQYRIRPRLRGVSIEPTSRIVGRNFGTFERAFQVTVAAYTTGGEWIYTPAKSEVIPANSIVAVFATKEELENLVSEQGVRSCRLKERAFSESTADFVEMLVPVGSKLAGQRIRDIAIRKNYGFAPLVISSGGKLKQYNLRSAKLRAGDILYGYASWSNLKNNYDPKSLWLLGTMPISYSSEKAPHAIIGLLLAIIGLFAGMPSALAFSVGVAWMIIARLFNFRDVISEMNWSTVALLGAMIPIGGAVTYSGAAEYLALLLFDFFNGMHLFELTLFIALASMIAGMAMTNVGAATVMIPLVVEVGVGLGLDVNLLAIGVALGVSNTFLLPGSQVNSFVQASGEYRTRDYIRVGALQTGSYALIISLTMYLGM